MDGSEELLQITESIAKLNSSYKSNQQFGDRVSSEERVEREQREILGGILNGEIVK